MANTRMWLVNKRLGQEILLAKYYPSTGWYTFHADLSEKLDIAFDEDEEISSFGPVDWILEYEQSE